MEGGGVIHDLSVSGMRLVTSVRLEPGTEVELYFRPIEGGAALRMPAEVVRPTEDGFAVRFSQLDLEMQELVLDTLKMFADVDATLSGSKFAETLDPTGNRT